MNQPLGVYSLFTNQSLAPDIGAATEDPTGLQYPESLPVRRLLVGEGVEAVEGEDDIEGFIRKGQRSHVPLLKTDVLKPVPPGAQAKFPIPG